ncbi:Cof-type HAD-IIB family hydrolase [Paenibacillus sp. KS1]|uniref:Cof-type HAD-IIB family hydrolase n=1 Tax=Paenibacillus sp. KS1 TaxID=1849249 RepID=UPI0009F1D63A|nr:Cof-type HAD-IIB family hydrolase [Paenibacillus sp. KS1]
MMTRSIVFFDIDGTLLNEQKRIDPSTKQAITQLQQSGIYTAIATGRCPASFKWVCEELNIHSFVSMNGQYVVFEGQVIHDNPIPAAEVDRLTTMADERNHPLVYLQADAMQKSMMQNTFIEALKQFQIERLPVRQVSDSNKPVYQILLFCNEQDGMEYAAHFPDYQQHRWGTNAVDFLHADTTKAVGLQKMIEHAGFSREHCYAFGDGTNDIEMLQFVGTGVAMGNASDDIQMHANYVTSSNNEDGIRNGLQAIGLI